METAPTYQVQVFEMRGPLTLTSAVVPVKSRSEASLCGKELADLFGGAAATMTTEGVVQVIDRYGTVPDGWPERVALVSPSCLSPPLTR